MDLLLGGPKSNASSQIAKGKSAPQMIYELSQTFYFEAAHTLVREIDAASSKRIHGHTYHAEATLRGTPDPATGMLMDLGHFCSELAKVRSLLDHHLLDEVEGLGPPTLEGLCSFIVEKLRGRLPSLASVKVWRATGDCCKLIISAPG